MRRVQTYIANKQVELGAHPFLRRLASDLPPSQVVPFVPQVSFFILGFQDIVQLAVEQASEPWLREILQQHRQEEQGHDKWFLRDLVRLAGEPPDLRVLFGPRHAPTRRATYALVREALDARDDVERLCLILTLESSSEVCFAGSQAYFERVGLAGELCFFAGHHLEIEREHTVFEGQMQAALDRIELTPEHRERACRVVDRAYAAVGVMLDGLERVLAEGSAPALHEEESDTRAALADPP